MNPDGPSPSARLPVVFVSHGAPTLALDPVAGADFARLGQSLPRPRAVLVLSAHWLDAPPTLGTSHRQPLLYDFAGFPERLHQVQYPAPGATELAAELAHTLSLRRDEHRPWDHGVWVPLLHMLPGASVPVLQLSVPYRWRPQQLFALGRQLAPWRQEGVLLLASGGMVHNLSQVDWRDAAPTPQWAVDFEQWVRERLLHGDVDGLLDHRRRAPAGALAHPTDDHFLPLLVAAGAAELDRDTAIDFPIEGFELGSLSRLAVRFG
jgi:4,5-DOPA dioxygenase extradiol